VDFRAAEQMGQLLLQVSGRAGRAEKEGRVLIQTHHPEHPLIQTLIQQGYEPFSQHLLAEREQTQLPPYSHFAIFRAESYTVEQASEFLKMIKESCANVMDAIHLMGPVPALMAKRKGLHCQHLLVRAEKRSALQQFLKHALAQIENYSTHQSVKWILDIDPVEV
jgi:primosomal protein N' (replication factor Y)